ncbi:hypothetical protein [Pelagerythrobacter rhizovicinus]|uniref:Tetratricopeptide repeat protein n=1 Tax=Pelagerythrobacter rhizovicinus TaxID=2268576 RepID=A0A4Q2KFZ6_9SPHN|nr:hypothetical protein [Pelagerythrobacter rhizovicinus]RXZ63944.1 hypothetical protein ETX26_08330 [Pelagerythrobacter rhizovicinus]
MRLAAPIFTAALLLAAPAAAQDAERHLQEAAELFLQAERAKNTPYVRIGTIRQAIAEVEKAEAALNEPRADVIGGKREMQLSLAEAYLDDGESIQALDTLDAILAGFGGEVPTSGATAMQYARALRLSIVAGFRGPAYDRGRTALAESVRFGRALVAGDPANEYLMRNLARDLTDEAFIRWVLGDNPGSDAAAAEALALWRQLYAAQPRSREAGNQLFVWMLHTAYARHDPALLIEAIEHAETLKQRQLFDREYEARLDAAIQRCPLRGVERRCDHRW